MRQERLKRRILEDIQHRLAQLLAERGVSASLELTHAEAVLTTALGKNRAKLGELPSHWRQLTPGQRTNRLTPLVEQLLPKLAPAPERRGWSLSLPLLALVLLTAGVGGAVVRDLSLQRQNTAQPEGGLTHAEVRRIRTQRVCEGVRSRVMRGGTAGQVDYEGWVVELIVVDEPNADAGAARDAWQAVFEPLSNDEVQLREPAGDAAKNDAGLGQVTTQNEGALRELRFALSLGYARAYFDELGRQQWVRIASDLFQRTHARHGALVARCAHQSSHHIGSWFAGRTVPDAAAALLHYAGVYSETPIFTRDYLPPTASTRPGLALLEVFATRAVDVDRTQLAMWLSSDQGMVSGREGRMVSLLFPYRDSNRASRSSLRLARRLGIANSR